MESTEPTGWTHRRRGAFSFHTEVDRQALAILLEARADWIGRENAGHWLQRESNDWDYFSYYDHDGEGVFRAVAIFPDGQTSYVTLELRTAGPDIDPLWHAHLKDVLDRLLPSLGATNIEPSDFEK